MEKINLENKVRKSHAPIYLGAVLLSAVALVGCGTGYNPDEDDEEKDHRTPIVVPRILPGQPGYSPGYHGGSSSSPTVVPHPNPSTPRGGFGSTGRGYGGGAA